MDKALPSSSKESWREGLCPQCKKAAGTFYLQEDVMVCHHCFNSPMEEMPSMVATEYLTPAVPNASPGHLRDIEDRRWHPTEKRMFYYSKEKPKTYFVPK